MSSDKRYERFIQHLRGWMFGMPEAEEVIPLLETRLTTEEAEFLADIPFFPHSIEQLTEKLGIPAAELSARLDPLARRGIVFRHESKDTVRYALNDSLFMFLRSPFWAGKTDETTRKLAVLGNKYFTNTYGVEFGKHPTMGLRAIPVEKTIKDTREIRPYEDVVKVIEQEDYFCTSTCPCRHRNNLDPDRTICKHETFNCLHFGRLARYMVQQGMGKEITREQAGQILRDAAEAGLVHGISNTQNGMDTICNCCSCCCLFFESMKVLQLNGIQASNYIVQIDTETCIGCGLCVERCPADALELMDTVSTLSPALCLGCGVCVYECPTESMSLVLREKDQDFPKNFREAAYRMEKERGRTTYPS